MRSSVTATIVGLLAVETWAQRVIHPAASRFHFYDMPTPLSEPCDVTAVTFNGEYIEWTEEVAGNNLARINLDGSVTEYPIPFTTAPVGNSSLPEIPGIPRPFISCGLDQGLGEYNDQLFAINGIRNQLVALNLSSYEINVFTAPNILGDVYPLSDLTPTPGAVWLTQSTGNSIIKFDLTTQKFTTYNVPTPAALPIGIYYSSKSKMIYFTEFAASKFGMINPKTGAVTEFDLPAELEGPMVIRAEIEDDVYWASTLGGSIGSFNTKTHKIKAYKIPGLARTPVEVCAQHGHVWYTYITQNRLGRLTPSTGKFLDVIEPGDLPPNGPVSTDPVIGDGIYCRTGSNRVLFSQMNFNRVGFYSP